MLCYVVLQYGEINYTQQEVCKKTHAVASTVPPKVLCYGNYALCWASLKPVGTIQVSLAVSQIVPENSLKFRTAVIFLKYAARLTTAFRRRLLCCKL